MLECVHIGYCACSTAHCTTDRDCARFVQTRPVGLSSRHDARQQNSFWKEAIDQLLKALPARSSSVPGPAAAGGTGGTAACSSQSRTPRHGSDRRCSSPSVAGTGSPATAERNSRTLRQNPFMHAGSNHTLVHSDRLQEGTAVEDNRRAHAGRWC